MNLFEYFIVNLLSSNSLFDNSSKTNPPLPRFDRHLNLVDENKLFAYLNAIFCLFMTPRFTEI